MINIEIGDIKSFSDLPIGDFFNKIIVTAPEICVQWM